MNNHNQRNIMIFGLGFLNDNHTEPIIQRKNTSKHSFHIADQSFMDPIYDFNLVRLHCYPPRHQGLAMVCPVVQRASGTGSRYFDAYFS